MSVSCRIAWALKYKVQELIDAKLLTFKEQGPNVKYNPFLGYPGPYANVIEDFSEIGLIKEVGNVKTLMLIIRENLTEVGLVQVQGVYKVCLSSPDEYEELKKMSSRVDESRYGTNKSCKKL